MYKSCTQHHKYKCIINVISAHTHIIHSQHQIAPKTRPQSSATMAGSFATTQRPNGPTVGRVLPERLDAVIHSQLPHRSILCRLGWMLRQILSTCELPLTDFHHKQGPLGSQTGQKCRIREHSRTRTAHSRQNNRGVKELQRNQADTILSPHAATT